MKYKCRLRTEKKKENKLHSDEILCLFYLTYIDTTCNKMWNRLYIWFFSSFLCWICFFLSLNSRTTWIKFTCLVFIWWTNSSVKFKKFHCRNELKQNTMNNIYQPAERKKKESVDAKKKRTHIQFENKFYSNSNKWATDKSIATEYCILCWKPEVRLHFAYHSLHIVHIVYSKWPRFMMHLIDSDFGIVWIFILLHAKIKWKRMESILNAILHLFWLSDWSTNETMFKRNSKLTEPWMERRHHLILFLI